MLINICHIPPPEGWLTQHCLDWRLIIEQDQICFYLIDLLLVNRNAIWNKDLGAGGFLNLLD